MTGDHKKQSLKETCKRPFAHKTNNMYILEQRMQISPGELCGGEQAENFRGDATPSPASPKKLKITDRH